MPERLTIAGLNLAWAQLAIDIAAATGGNAKAPPLADFIPDVPIEEPVEAPVDDFGGWARSLLALAS